MQCGVIAQHVAIRQLSAFVNGMKDRRTDGDKKG